MGRMASMQVLNQAFANANAAFNAYMRNKNEQRINDLNEEFGRLDRQYRAEQARQRQSNLDRMYELAINRDKQAQANWQAAFDAKQADSAAAKRANNMKAIATVLLNAKDAPTANALINGLGVGFEDPVEQGTFLNDYYNNKKLSDFGKQLDDYQSFANKLQLARAKQQQQELSERRKYDVEMAKIKQTEEANALKNAIPYLTGKMQISSNENPYNADNAVNELNMVRAKLNGAYAPQMPYAAGGENIMTPEQALQAYKDGKITKEQLAELRKNF